MLRQIADGVLVHESEFIQSNAVVVRGSAGLLLIDPGLDRSEMDALANDLQELGQPVVAGFATHAHWDHVLWVEQFGPAPRYGTARCAADIQAFLSDASWKDQLVEELPPEITDLPLELFGLITGLPPGTDVISWDGPPVRIIEHQGHAAGHAALLIEQQGVLVAGDMLSDVLVPLLDFGAAEPIDDYLAALRLFDSVAGDVESVVPGHGSVGKAGQARARIDLDLAYIEALRDGTDFSDPRIGPNAKEGWEWVSDVHEGQLQGLSQGRD